MKIQYVNGFVIAGAMAFSGMALAANHMNHEYRLGQIKIESPYTRSTAPGQKVAGGFMKIDNKGPADQLISASSPIAGEMQLHIMAMDGNVMKMRELKVIDIPANSSVELKPGGLHLMFMDIKAPLKSGESVAVKLKFQKAGEVEIKVPVRDITGSSGHMKY